MADEPQVEPGAEAAPHEPRQQREEHQGGGAEGAPQNHGGAGAEGVAAGAPQAPPGPVTPPIAREPLRTREPRPTVAAHVWVALGAAVVFLILLIVFIAENSRSVTISFLGAKGHLALGLALLIAAVAGALILLLIGSTRIIQLRLALRRQGPRRVR